MIYGYARASIVHDDLPAQVAALKASGCSTVWTEERTDAIRDSRAELGAMLDLLRDGDTLVVTRFDRLARSLGDLQDIVRSLEAKGVNLRASERAIDTGQDAPMGFLDMLPVFVEFEANLRKERQMQGIAKAKAEGAFKGRKPSIDVSKVRELQASGLGPTEIANKLGIGRASVYRAIATPRLEAPRRNAEANPTSVE